MVAQGNVNPTPPTQQAGSDGGSGFQGTPRATSAKQHGPEVLHQRSKMPVCPARMALGGFAVAAVLGYLTLYTKKKPEATALDVARVASGTATTENTRPRD